jgi:xanthine phosphoribosyltransferase
MKKLYYSYEDFKNDTRNLIVKLQPYDTIIGISRGGLTLSQAIAEALDIRDVQTIQTQLYDTDKKRDLIFIVDNTSLKENTKVLVVDDIADSGETLKEVMGYLKKKYPKISFESATLFYKHSSCYEPTYWVREATCWIEFFWEVDFIATDKN